MKRNAPFNLEELALIDCKLSGTVLENLLEVLANAHQLKKLTLIKPNHSTRSFAKLVHLVETSQHLVELDISWQGVQAQTMGCLLTVLRSNRFLHSLSLGYNRLLQDPGEAYPSEPGPT